MVSEAKYESNKIIEGAKSRSVYVRSTVDEEVELLRADAAAAKRELLAAASSLAEKTRQDASSAASAIITEAQ